MKTIATMIGWRIPAFLVGLSIVAPATTSAQAPEPAVPRLEPTASAFFPAYAGSADESADAAPTLPLPGYGGWVSVTKWATLGASVGFGAWGFKLNSDADDIFARLEARCREQPENCRSRNPDGSYTDPNLESKFQRALDKDDQARTALIASQLFFGASVVLFIVDFQRDEGPDNEPYEPDDEGQSSLQLTAIPGEIVVRYYFW
jgi:hypothetical protein